MGPRIVFGKTGYDPRISFLKGYAILFVILGHTIPDPLALGYPFWGGMQVPIFLLIQSFHVFKKDTLSPLDYRRLLIRIITPFLLAQGFLLAVKCQRWGLDIFLTGGGYGPGSFFVWVYLQFVVLLRCLFGLFKKLPVWKLAVIFVGISVCLEVALSYYPIPEWLYRLLAIRYIYLIYLGFLWARQGIVMSPKWLALSLVSMIFIALLVYSTIDWRPFFCKTDWLCHRWICYYYVSGLLAYALCKLAMALRNSRLGDGVFSVVEWMGNYSYEIYLAQMVILCFVGLDALSFTSSRTLNIIIFSCAVVVLSMIGGLVIRRLIDGIQGRFQPVAK